MALALPLTVLFASGVVTSALFGAVRIVDAAEAARRLPGASVLDARSARDFARGHVPGSRRVDWRDWTLEKPGLAGALFGDPARWGRVPPPDQRLEGRLRALGLSNAKPILVVGEPGGWGEEGRIAWNLLYWGADEVWLLDGGFSAWRDPSRPVEAGAARSAPLGDFVLRLRPERRIETAALKAALDERTPRLLDARTPEEFAGRTLSGQKRGGHLPTAHLVPEKSLYERDGRYVGTDELKKLTGLGSAGEDRSPSRPITYCTGGVRSALLAVLLEARLGILAANYDGSLWEWSADPSLPLEK